MAIVQSNENADARWASLQMAVLRVKMYIGKQKGGNKASFRVLLRIIAVTSVPHGTARTAAATGGLARLFILSDTVYRQSDKNQNDSQNDDCTDKNHSR